MIGEIRKGVTRRELMRVLLLSERPEEQQQAALWTEKTAPLPPDYDPNAFALIIDGRVMAAGGLRNVSATEAALWLVSMIDLYPYRFPLMRYAHRLLTDAKTRGMTVVSLVPTNVPKARLPSEKLGLRPGLTYKDYTLYSI